jgi:hypothetical protein
MKRKITPKVTKSRLVFVFPKDFEFDYFIKTFLSIISEESGRLPEQEDWRTTDNNFGLTNESKGVAGLTLSYDTGEVAGKIYFIVVKDSDINFNYTFLELMKPALQDIDAHNVHCLLIGSCGVTNYVPDYIGVGDESLEIGDFVFVTGRYSLTCMFIVTNL